MMVPSAASATPLSDASAQLQTAIEAYAADPTTANAAAVDTAMADYNSTVAANATTTHNASSTINTRTVVSGETATSVNGGAVVTYTAPSGAVADGGVFYIDASGQLSLAGASADLNDGGATSSILIADNLVNQDGGGIYNDGGSLTFSDTSFLRNLATTGLVPDGGGIYNVGGIVTGTDFSFIDNEAHYGAAISTLGGEISLMGGSFTGNQATSRGGAIYNESSAITLVDVSFIENSAADSAGAIRNLLGGSIDVLDSSFTDNQARYGGAIQNSGGVVNITGTSFEGNSSPNGYGGAITNGDTMTIRDSSFTDNTAGTNGGAIENHGGSLTAINTSFTGNTATSGGGALYVVNSTQVTISGSSFSDNQAAFAGAIYAFNSGLEINNSSFTGNSSNAYGGAVFFGNGTLDLGVSTDDVSLFSGNTINGVANSIGFYTAAGLNADVNVSVDSGGLLDMRDPMSVFDNGGILAFSKTGSGAWALGGDNDFTQSGTGKTTFDVAEGALYLYGDGTVSNASALGATATVATGNLALAGVDSTFTVGGNATLIAGGDNTISTDGTITFADGATIRGGTAADATDIHGGSTLAATGGATSLTFTAPGDLVLEGALNLAAPGSADTFTLYTDLVEGGSVVDLNVGGAGRTVLTGTNTYTGATTIADGATLALSGTGSIEQSSGVTVGVGGGFDIAATDAGASITTLNGAGSTVLGSELLTVTDATGAYSGVISGAGGTDFTTAATYTLLGNSTYTGGTTITTGTLQLGDGGNSGEITGDVLNNGALIFNRGNEMTLAGVISGTGPVSQIGAGTTILSGDNTYTGSTTISAGTLQLGDGGTSGSIVGGVANDGILAFNRSDAFTFSEVISGAGSVSQIGSGNTILTGTNTYAGGTAITAGTLQLGNGGTSGLIIGDVANDGAFTFNRSDALGFSGIISGTGSVNQIGGGTTILTGDNTYAGSTIISAGTLQLGDGGTSGSIVGDVANDGSLVFNRSDAVTFAGVVSGTGTVSQTGSGATILTSDSTYTGGTTVSDGTLQLGDGGTSGWIVGDVLNDGAFVFDRSDAVNFAGVFSGGGAIRQVGAGMTTLTADSSGFSGHTTVEAGILSVNGTLGGTADVFSGARLQGIGEVGATVSNGIIAPGNSIGTLTVNGNYDSAGSVLEIETMLDGTGSPADRLLITGDVSGTTSVQVINLGGAGASTGTASTEGISIIQVAGDSVADAFQLAGGYAAIGPYQYHLNAFDPAGSADTEMDGGLASAGATDFWDYRLQSEVDESGDPIPVPQVPGYQALPSGALQYGWSILDSLHKRLGEIRTMPGTQGDAASKANSELFLRGTGERGDFDGDRGPDYTQKTWFTQAGGNVITWDVGSEGGSLRGGLALSYGGSELDVKKSSAKVDLKGVSAALASTYQSADGWRVDGVAIGTRYSSKVKTDERGETGNPDGWGAGFSIEGGYPVDLGDGVTIEPQSQLVFQRVWFDKFTDVDNLVVNLQDGDSLRWRVGARVQKVFEKENSGKHTVWTPYAQVDLINEMLNGGNITAAGVDFGTDVGGSSVRLSTGMDARLADRWTVYAHIGYEAGFSNGSADSFGGGIGVRRSF